MESKTKHRILGIVVVAGLAIIAYPFIQPGSSTSIEEAQIKAPEFPDQAIQLADETTTTEIPIDSSAASGNQDAPSTPDSLTATQPKPDQLTPNQNQANEPASTTTNTSQPTDDQTTTAPAPSQNRDGGMGVSTVPGSSPAVNTPSVAVPPATTPAAPSAPIAAPSSADATPASSIVNEDATSTLTSAPTANDEADKPAIKAVSAEADAPKAKKVAASHKRTKKTVHAASDAQPALLSKLTTASAIHANRNKPLDNNGLVQLKKAAWVIQMGSFKQKSNALKLVNSLRAQGYRAFIQHAVVASGENTRVFVGPEQQQAAARIVASELETKMKLRGIVISYKPFNL